MLKKLNEYLLERPKLLLALVWVFFLLAFIPAVYITLTNPTMGFFPFLARILIQTAIALYLRMLYARIQNKRKEERKAARKAEREAANASRHHHKKKK